MNDQVTQIIVKRAPRGRKSDGLMLVDNKSYPCLLGKNGITARKQEGDYKTPTGKFPLLFGYYRKDRISKINTQLDLYPLHKDDLWCDDPSHACYNRPVISPFSSSHENMHRDDGLYDVVIVMDHNFTNRVRNRGSAIFVHLTADRPWTAGCIAIEKKIMVHLLQVVHPRTELIVLP